MLSPGVRILSSDPSWSDTDTPLSVSAGLGGNDVTENKRKITFYATTIPHLSKERLFCDHSD